MRTVLGTDLAQAIIHRVSIVIVVSKFDIFGFAGKVAAGSIILLVLLLLIGCGTAPAPDSSGSSSDSDDLSAENQIFVGLFMLEDGTPVTGALVTFEPGGEQDVTDENGIAEVETRLYVSQPNVRLDSAFGTFRVRLNQIPNTALVISYEVQMRNGNSEAELGRVEITASSEPEPESDDNPGSDSTDQEEEQDEDEDQDDDQSSKDGKNDQNKDKKPSGVNCNGSCHEPRVPRCGNKAWELINSTHAGWCKSNDDKDSKKGKDKGKKDRSYDSSESLVKLLRSL